MDHHTSRYSGPAVNSFKVNSRRTNEISDPFGWGSDSRQDSQQLSKREHRVTDYPRVSEYVRENYIPETSYVLENTGIDEEDYF